ncbi:hypothetical protein I547_4093 [Mycobacterium kansasii 824]|uniref:Uncharacterized protein n=1 Tax=Mycobacterium kansasii ATCC 12478 TaxID=557599 RepID=U5X175_MYCKA|nr:hypothetical protein MKAN_05935 [Mycobacterium kansasii ATCC 12478]EUA01159.1 hypothetical protein I547_4093 [Mycobacterium kansasii 824]KEP40105.1 hypothetical protein MKSMC1_46680 [Mycobacterium kansasii]
MLGARRPQLREALLIADLDRDQRRDWLESFRLPSMRRNESYGPIVELA